MRFHPLLIALIAGFITTACSGSSRDSTGLDESESPMTIQLTSAAFVEGANIPIRYSCDGENVSPPLSWSNLPEGAQSLALITDDPDAPGRTFVHWVLYNIPPDVTGLPPVLPPTANISGGIVQGTNDMQRLGYGGLCPPAGDPHHYHFKLYALDIRPQLAAGATKQDLVQAMDGHILAEGLLIGLYQRH